MRGSLTQTSPGSWTITFDLPRSPDGKRRQKRVTVRGTKRQAEREMARLLNELSRGNYSSAADMTVADYLQRWLKEYAETTLRPQSQVRYEQVVRGKLIPYLGRARLDRLQPLEIQTAWNALVGEGYSPKSVLLYHRVLHRALEVAVRWELVGRNVADQVDPPRIPFKQRRILNGEEIADLIGKSLGHQCEIPIALGALAGMRIGEICGLHWRDVNLREGWLRVGGTSAATKDRGVFIDDTKTEGSRRIIRLPSLAVEVLGRHYPNRLGDLVYCRANGETYRVGNASQVISRFCRNAGYPITPHALRHSHASLLMSQNVHPKVVAERLGHSHISTTLDLYTHVLPAQQEAAAQAVNDALGGINVER